MNDYYLEKSDNKKHKYMVHFINPKTKKLNTIRFGASGYDDFIISKGNEDKKKNYIKRHSKEDWSDLEKAGTWSRFLLWNKKSLKASIKDMGNRFGIKIHLVE
jgi:hypothetical protein